jgi:hypothetical protein
LKAYVLAKRLAKALRFTCRFHDGPSGEQHAGRR